MTTLENLQKAKIVMEMNEENKKMEQDLIENEDFQSIGCY